MLFVIRKPDEVRTDGFVSRRLPFAMNFDGFRAYVAFKSVAMARHFVETLGLDEDYVAVPLESVDQEDLRDSIYACVFRSRSQIYKLVDGVLSVTVFLKNLVEIR